MAKLFRNWLRTLGAPEDPVATDTTSEWSAMSLLKAIFKAIQDGTFFTAHIASQAEAEAGTNNTHLMTPLRTGQQIATYVASETDVGLIRLATAAETIVGTAVNIATHPQGVTALIESIVGDVTFEDGVGTIGAGKVTNTMLNADVFSSAHSWSARQTYNLAPVYDQASNVLGTGIFMPLDAATHTVAASKQFDHVRLSQADGSANIFTAAAGAIVGGFTANLQSASGSDSTSNLYAVNAIGKNAGPGSVKAIHTTGQALTGSTGVTMGGVAEIIAVSTSSTASCAWQLTTGTDCADDVASFIQIGGAARVLYGFGTNVAPISVKTAMFQAWFATGTHADARTIQALNNAGVEQGYIDKLFNVVGPTITGTTNLIAGSATNGVTIGQSTVSRNHANGSLTFAAGTAAGNTFAIETGGAARVSISDSLAAVTVAVKAFSNTAIPAGGTAGSGFLLSSATNFGVFFGSGAPTLSAAKGSLYLRSDGSSTSTRLYVNTDGATAWTNVTTAT